MGLPLVLASDGQLIPVSSLEMTDITRNVAGFITSMTLEWKSKTYTREITRDGSNLITNPGQWVLQ